MLDFGHYPASYKVLTSVNFDINIGSYAPMNYFKGTKWETMHNALFVDPCNPLVSLVYVPRNEPEHYGWLLSSVGPDKVRDIEPESYRPWDARWIISALQKTYDRLMESRPPGI